MGAAEAMGGWASRNINLPPPPKPQQFIKSKWPRVGKTKLHIDTTPFIAKLKWKIFWEHQKKN